MKTLIAVSVLTLAMSGGTLVQAEDAKAIYTKECAKCHGATGKGDTKQGKKVGCKDYTDAKVQAELKDDKALKSIKEGMKDGDKELMKAYGDKFSDDEIKALVAYMRAFKK